MQLFNIQWKDSAKKELKKIDKTEISKILSEIEKLIIEIIRVRHRKEAYRKFP